VPENLLKWFARAQDAMGVEEDVKTGGIQRLIELSRYTTCLYPPLANEEPTSLSQEPESFQDAGSKSLELRPAVVKRDPVQVGYLWRYRGTEARCAGHDGNNQQAIGDNAINPCLVHSRQSARRSHAKEDSHRWEPRI